MTSGLERRGRARRSARTIATGSALSARRDAGVSVLQARASLPPGEGVRKHPTRDTDAGVRVRRRPLGGGDPHAAAAATPAALGESESRRLPKAAPRAPAKRRMSAT